MSCEPIIGLDGAFLKGKYDEELLTTFGLYANDQMLSFAYVVIEVESKALCIPKNRTNLLNRSNQFCHQQHQHMLPNHLYH